MSKYTCRTCGTKGEENFYKSAQYQCKSCWNKRTYQTGIEKLNRLKTARGGCCERCGYNKYLGALQWHHTDPTVKEYGIGQRRGLTESQLQDEVDKCQLLCANCHAEVHAVL